MGVGSLLEKARVEQGLTIEELAERTKIRPQFLQAIEEEQYHLLPDQAYVRPFIRTYARALGVEDQLQVEVEPRESTLRVDDLSASIRERRERARRARRTRFLIRFAVLIVLLAGAAYLAYWMMLRGN
ncbi:MAG: helix-turn-helix domain-containing protein [Limnochordia bacterium]|nr:helix-turn-helix domain-containing protein [Limnochordia bacterium]MDI9465930.1 helix-turn-helix domain-containing protein [Bacillota bacterium]NLO94493.1 helix-turn-helix domain-containing protein [Bacillota bacterium]HOB40494.1 helix-turn-helix domain-containing protein [Limnochordia bacterium]HOK31651.1 helix-turn-helix domain-containing protein [Limnochordia bacterium]